jgi:hypothetical protein
MASFVFPSARFAPPESFAGDARPCSIPGDFKQTGLVNLRSDADGNAFLNQYVVVKDLEQGAFGKVRPASSPKTPRRIICT